MKLSDLIISQYVLVDDGPLGPAYVTMDRVPQREGPPLWAIRESGACLNKQGEWELEPMPSSRTKAFFKRCRWKSAEAALAFWVKSKCDSRFAHYRNPEKKYQP